MSDKYERAVDALGPDMARDADTDVVGPHCGCDEYPECTHSLYWYMGFKAARDWYAKKTAEAVATQDKPSTVGEK